MLKQLSHIILSLVLLFSLTGVSAADTVCKCMADKNPVEECKIREVCDHGLADEKCCEVSKELKKLGIDLSAEWHSVAVPEFYPLSSSFIDTGSDYNVAMLLKGAGDLLYVSHLQIQDLHVLNQNFRI